jgi:hypothetical protein
MIFPAVPGRAEDERYIPFSSICTPIGLFSLPRREKIIFLKIGYQASNDDELIFRAYAQIHEIDPNTTRPTTDRRRFLFMTE